MHVTRFKPTSQAEGELRRCREGLLSLLADCLPASRHPSITIVFDSANAPKHLADRSTWKHLQVVFARDENSADDMLAVMIAQQPNPKQYVVVSSDHRVQVAAQRRRATPVDSDVWFDAVLELKATTDAKPSKSNRTLETRQSSEATLSPHELASFRKAMSEPKELEPLELDPLERLESNDAGDGDKPTEIDNPFPEGYFDDCDEY